MGVHLLCSDTYPKRRKARAFRKKFASINRFCSLALGRSRRPGGGGADVVSGTSCSQLPAGPWGVVRGGGRRVCGFAAGVARGGAGVGARSERAAALLRGRFGSCCPVSVSSVRCLCCRDALRASGYLL